MINSHFINRQLFLTHLRFELVTVGRRVVWNNVQMYNLKLLSQK